MPRRPEHPEPDPQLPLEDLPFTRTTDVAVFELRSGEPIAVPYDVVMAAERAYRCYQRRLGGESWMVIAEEEGYPSAAAAAADVRRYTEEGAALVTEHSKAAMLQMELARLDALQAQVWPAAMQGNLAAIEMARKLIVDRVKVAGLDPEKIASETQTAGRTVVVESSEAGFVRDLRSAAGE